MGGVVMDSANPVSATTESQVEGLPQFITSPILDAGGDTYYRDLPELLKTHHNWWVAYYGDERIGPARTHLEIRRLCRDRRFDWSLLWVACIEAEPEFE